MFKDLLFFPFVKDPVSVVYTACALSLFVQVVVLNDTVKGTLVKRNDLVDQVEQDVNFVSTFVFPLDNVVLLVDELNSLWNVREDVQLVELLFKVLSLFNDQLVSEDVVEEENAMFVVFSFEVLSDELLCSLSCYVVLQIGIVN